MKRSFSEKEEHYFFDVDFVNHVVLIAVAKTNGFGTSAGRSSSRAGQGRSGVLVVDDYQGHGLGAS